MSSGIKRAVVFMFDALCIAVGKSQAGLARAHFYPQ